jgi:5-methylcytosine-specific restriction endonuclease McrA
MSKRISLNSFEVLKCNSQGRPISFMTPEKMFGDLATWQVHARSGEFRVDPKSNQKFRKMKAYIIDWEQHPDGGFDTTQVKYMTLVDWDVWQQLEPSDYDLEQGLYVSTGKRKIKVPRVVQSLTWDEMPKKRFKLNFETMYELYEGTCAYTRKLLSKSEANLDHVIPRDKGGQRTFGNMVLSDKTINTRKGNRHNHEVGLPAVTPIIPVEMDMSLYLKNPRNIPEWNLFLGRKKHQ